MAKYVCSVCGYVYYESEGIPEDGVAKGTKWKDLPADWECPLCGAGKDDFEKEGDETMEVAVQETVTHVEVSSDMKEFTPAELNILCTNLAQGCEKQYKNEEAALFNELASYFKKGVVPAKDPSLEKLMTLIEKDLNEGFTKANDAANAVRDRGALRALVWSGKVTRILKSLLTRYEKMGEKMLEDTGVYVCTVCGFVYVGNELPEVCPICKVPNFKFQEIKGR